MAPSFTVSAATADGGGLLGWGLGLLGMGAGCEVTVTVQVPAGSRVHATTRYGSVSTEGPLADCRIRTDYGDVHLGRTGPLEVRGRHGEITVEHVTGPAEIVTSSGDVRVGVLEGSASITNDHSDITVAEAAGPLRLKGSHATWRSSGCWTSWWPATPTAASGSPSWWPAPAT